MKTPDRTTAVSERFAADISVEALADNARVTDWNWCSPTGCLRSPQRKFRAQRTTNWRPEHETFGMKTCSIIIAACLAAGGAAAAQTSSPGQDQVLTRISNQTGAPE